MLIHKKLMRGSHLFSQMCNLKISPKETKSFFERVQRHSKVDQMKLLQLEIFFYFTILRSFYQPIVMVLTLVEVLWLFSCFLFMIKLFIFSKCNIKLMIQNTVFFFEYNYRIQTTIFQAL